MVMEIFNLLVGLSIQPFRVVSGYVIYASREKKPHFGVSLPIPPFYAGSTSTPLHFGQEISPVCGVMFLLNLVPHSKHSHFDFSVCAIFVFLKRL